MKNKIVKNLVASLLCVLICLSFILVLISSFLKQNVFDSTQYNNYVTPSCINLLKSELKQSINAQILNLGLPVDVVYNSIDDNELKKQTISSFNSLVNKILYNQKYIPSQYPRQAIYDSINKYVIEYSKTHKYTLKTQLVDELTTEIVNMISSNVNILSQNLIEKIPSISNKINILKVISNQTIVFCILIFVLVILLFVIYGKNYLKALYYSTISIWVGSALLFVPLLFSKLYKLEDKLILEQSKIKIIIQSLIKDYISSAFNFMFVLFLIVTIILVFVIVLYYTFSKNNKIEQLPIVGE